MSLPPDLMRRIVNGLVRIEDIVENKRVYGGIVDNDRQLVIQAVQSAKRASIASQDIYESLVEYYRTQLNEIGPIMPVTGMTSNNQPPKTAAQTAAPGAQTNRPVTPADTAANVAMSLRSISPQELERTIDAELKKDPNFSKHVNKSFAQILAGIARGQK